MESCGLVGLGLVYRPLGTLVGQLCPPVRSRYTSALEETAESWEKPALTWRGGCQIQQQIVWNSQGLKIWNSFGIVRAWLGEAVFLKLGRACFQKMTNLSFSGAGRQGSPRGMYLGMLAVSVGGLSRKIAVDTRGRGVGRQKGAGSSLYCIQCPRERVLSP